MQITTYIDRGACIGAVDGDHVWNLRELYAWHVLETEGTPHSEALAERLVPADMATFIRINNGRLDEFAEAVERARGDGPDYARRPLSSVRLMPPVPNPNKILCCGSSYWEYCRGFPMAREYWPQDVKISFLKPPTALIGHGATIPYPPDAELLDYENEMAIVIGRTCSDISEKDADNYIFGYSILNDSCVRDIEKWMGGGDAPRGKAADGFAPMGPWIVPGAYLKGDPNNLKFTTHVDGELRQDSSTSRLMWSVQHAVAYISRYIKLFPGDIISTGSTLGNGHLLNKHLKQGQVVRCEIEGIGVLENTVGRKTWHSEVLPMPPEPVAAE